PGELGRVREGQDLVVVVERVVEVEAGDVRADLVVQDVDPRRVHAAVRQVERVVLENLVDRGRLRGRDDARHEPVDDRVVEVAAHVRPGRERVPGDRIGQDPALI